MLKIFPKTFNILPNWQNFAKSGHTANLIDSSINDVHKILLFWPNPISVYDIGRITN